MTRKYNVNDDYFSEIDTEHKAYWLGFLMADGYINTREGQDRLVLDLAIKDMAHLELYKQDLSFTGPVSTYTIKTGKFVGYKHTLVSITSQKIVNDLSYLGCIPRKSLILKFPLLSLHLVRHFVRGYFDGDGSAFISNEKHWRSGKISPVIHFRFVGTKEFLTRLDAYIGLKGHLRQPKGTLAWELSYKRNKKVGDFYTYLYKDATIFLTRKSSIFEDHIKQRCSETIIS